MALAATPGPAAIARAPRATAAKFRGANASRTVAPRRSPALSVGARVPARPRPRSRGVLTLAAARAGLGVRRAPGRRRAGEHVRGHPAPARRPPTPPRLQDGGVPRDAGRLRRGLLRARRPMRLGNCNFPIAAARLGLARSASGTSARTNRARSCARRSPKRACPAPAGVPGARRRSGARERAHGQDADVPRAERRRGRPRVLQSVRSRAVAFVIGGAGRGRRRRAEPRRARAPSFVNGFVFDEQLRPSAVRSAVAIAKANGAKVYFDPGPRVHVPRR